MSTSSGFVDEHSARRHPLEQEGFAAAVGLAAGEFPICGSSDTYAPIILADFRGPLSAPDGAPWGQGSLPPILGRRSVEWETSPAASSDATVFTWVGGSQVRPFRPAYPYAT